MVVEGIRTGVWISGTADQRSSDFWLGKRDLWGQQPTQDSWNFAGRKKEKKGQVYAWLLHNIKGKVVESGETFQLREPEASYHIDLGIFQYDSLVWPLELKPITHRTSLPVNDGCFVDLLYRTVVVRDPYARWCRRRGVARLLPILISCLFF